MRLQPVGPGKPHCDLFPCRKSWIICLIVFHGLNSDKLPQPQCIVSLRKTSPLLTA
jgi:hypothetical protein